MAAVVNGAGISDLQLRMSKKIAQLTKVIYHLNNKNEDNDLDLQDMAEQYEAEIEQILKDTADKVNVFKAQLDDARDEKRIQDMQKQMEAKYEDERRRCLTELENVRKRAAEKEAAIQKAATKQIDSLTGQLEQLQEQLQARIKEIADVGKNSQSSNKELQDALRKAKQETEESIQAGNRKYNDMLAAAMRTEDQLKAGLEEVKGKLQLEAAARQEAGQSLTERQQEWDQLRAELQEQAKASDASWKAKVESLVEELQREKGESKAAARAAAVNEEKAQARIADLEGALTRTEADLRSNQAEVQRLMKELEALQQVSMKESQQLKEEIAGAQEQIRILELSSAGDRDAMDKAATSARADREQLSSELLSTKDQLKNTSKELESRTAELASLQDALSKLQLDHASRIKGFEAQVSGLEEDVRRAQEQGQGDAVSAAKQAHEDMERKLAAAEEKAKKALEAAQQEAALKLEATARDAAIKLDIANKDADSRQAKAEEKLRSEMCDMEARLKEEHAFALDKLAQAHAATCDTMSRDADQLKQEIDDLHKQLVQEKERYGALDAERGRLAAELDSRSRSANATHSQLEDQLRKVEASETSLKKEVEALKSTLSQVEKEAQERAASMALLQKDLEALRKQKEEESMRAKETLASELEKLDDQWTKKAAEQIEDAVAKREAQLRTEMTALRLSLTNAGAEAQAEVEAKLRAEISSLSSKSAKDADLAKAKHAEELEAERKRAAEELASQKLRFEQMLSETQSEALARQQGAEGGLKQQMAEALSKQKQKHEESMAALQQKLEKDLAALKEQQEEDLAKAALQHQTQVEALQRAAADERAAAEDKLRQVERKLTSSRDEEVAGLKKSHEEAMSALVSQHNATLEGVRKEATSRESQLQGNVSRLESTNGSLTKSKDSLEAEGKTLRQRIEELQVAMANRAAESADTMFRLKQDHADEKEKLLRSYREDKEVLTKAHDSLVEALQQQVRQAQEEGVAKLADLTEQHAELRALFDSRPPRDEDVARIRKLEVALAEAEELVRTSEERMQQLRAELLLREETYNNHFKNGGAGEKVLNAGNAVNADASVMSWMLNRKASAKGKDAKR
ncbi:hypothetical protein CEUSTIGMA_g1491.t1 [Chlamydomonas eustigma]|uniref:Protein FAM184A/B N-terminal domain-containing protein n=1 Tax=Chlamydomonas eustigma TaxID=1157962 RepID=A0A250WTB0_9CHLO|nr:hypothetical protein CEUSTIGMA_g1491.t1 [Chlamydomonas eustigma]|eukprot:GAX74041.1 hypothetical protein CEUSTIGMA_g1491.t1 [Chlamydomonas eustigma]